MSLNNMFRIKEQLTKKKPHTLKMPSKFADMTDEEMDQSGNGPIGCFAASAISFATCGLSAAAMRCDVGDRDIMFCIHAISGIVGLITLSVGFCSLRNGSIVAGTGNGGYVKTTGLGDRKFSSEIAAPDSTGALRRISMDLSIPRRS